MRIMVTGGAGFIGSHVAEALLDAGHEVVIVDNLSSGHRRNIPPGATFYEIDIRDEDLSRVFQEVRPEIVSHHAAQMSVRISIEEPRLDAAVNVEGSVNLLECARASGTRKIIYASTGGALYGEPEYLPCTEDHPVAPLSHYGVSKYTVERYLDLYSRLYGLDYTVLRYPNVYGPRQDPEGEAGVIAIFIGRMLAGHPIDIFGDGTQERDFVYVADVARATHGAIHGASRGVINLGSNIGTSVWELYTTLAQMIGYNWDPHMLPARLGEVYRIYLSGDRAKDLIGWEPTFSLHEGLAETLAWSQGRGVRSNGRTVANIAGA